MTSPSSRSDAVTRLRFLSDDEACLFIRISSREDWPGHERFSFIICTQAGPGEMEVTARGDDFSSKKLPTALADMVKKLLHERH